MNTDTVADQQQTMAPSAPAQPTWPSVPTIDTSAWIPDSLGMWAAIVGAVIAALAAILVWFVGPAVLTSYDTRLIKVITLTLVIITVVLTAVAIMAGVSN